MISLFDTSLARSIGVVFAFFGFHKRSHKASVPIHSRFVNRKNLLLQLFYKSNEVLGEYRSKKRRYEMPISQKLRGEKGLDFEKR